jgi:glycosyltransferase involved in cell wall biosynthesis
LKKVLLCSNFYPPGFIGGAELIAHQQALCLQRAGWDVAVFAGDAHVEGKRYDVSQRDYQGVPVYRVKLGSEDFQPEFASFFHEEVEKHFSDLLDNFRPDVVHAHNLIGLSLGILHAAKRRGIRTLLTLHDYWGFCYKNTILKREAEICRNYLGCAECMAYIPNGGNGFPIQVRQSYMALQLSAVDVFISPSQYLADRYVQAGFPAEKMTVVWNGVNARRFSEIRKTESPGQVRFTFIGYLGEHKGVTSLLDALVLIPMRERVFVNVVGGGHLLPDLQRRVRDMGLQSCVKFWGKVDNDQIAAVFGETDVQILPSVYPENQPVSITEAMASRTAVIGSRVGGIPELVSDGETGYLFEPGNPAELAAAMSRFVAHPEKIKAFGEAGFRRIANKSLENQVERIRELYCGPEPRGPWDSPAAALIPCTGGFSPDCSRAVADLWESAEERARYRFVMADWLAEDQFARGLILWVSGSDWSGETICRALRQGIALLVPESSRELRDLCRTQRCGVYYGDAAEAREALRYLHENRELLGQLGSNAAGCPPPAVKTGR